MRNLTGPGTPRGPVASAVAVVCVSASALYLLAASSGCTKPTATPSAPPPAPVHIVVDVRADHRTLRPSEAADYVGDAACLPCHPDITRDNARSPHARTLRPVTVADQGPLFNLRQTVTDAQVGYTYRPIVKSTVCAIAVHTPQGDHVGPALYGIGSGKHGTTYLGGTPPTWRILRLSYYHRSGRWDFSPQQQPGDVPDANALGTDEDPQNVVTCLGCHVTYMEANGDGPDLAHSHIGIGCERCHGPARAHVESAIALAQHRTTKLVELENLTKAPRERTMAICGSCHETETTPSLADPATRRDLPRFQATALAMSRCYKESRVLTCTTCHNPHQGVDSNPAHNDAICLKCHGPVRGAGLPAAAVTGKQCPVNKKAGCIGCHLPLQVIQTIKLNPFHNHYIRNWKKPLPAS